MERKQTSPAIVIPPGTEPWLSVTCKDVVLGRGSGTQNHCGNVTYRKLVYLNKELYATSSKFDKLKISKAIVAAVREFGGHFVQPDKRRGGLFYDIGDKRAWDKTSQALREGQAEIRQQLAAAHPSGMSKVAEYQQVISQQTFFAYACKMLESLYQPNAGASGFCSFSACGQQCPHAKRRATLSQLGVDPMRIHQAMQSLNVPILPSPSAQMPPPQSMRPQQSFVQHDYNPGMMSARAVAAMVTSTTPMQPSMQAPMQPSMQPPMQPSMQPLMQPSMQLFQAIEPLPFDQGIYVNGVASAPVGSIEPLPYALGPSNTSTMPGGYQNYPSNLPFQSLSQGDQKPRATRETVASNGSTGSVFSLRQFCSADLEITTEEGKVLMEQLSMEVDDLIRRKSYALLQIDTGRAFEDLVFEEDSVVIDGPKPEELLLSDKHASSSSSSGGRSSGMSSGRNSGMSSRSGRLSSKDDMSLMSLMNMSILTLDERGESEGGESSSHMGGPSSKEKKTIPKPIIKHQDSPATTTHTKAKQRVSWATSMNFSLMSLDDRSFRQLVECICDPEEVAEQEKNTRENHQVSRKMGFPIGRKGVAEQFRSTSPPNGRKADAEQYRRGPEVSQSAEQCLPEATGMTEGPGCKRHSLGSFPDYADLLCQSERGQRRGTRPRTSILSRSVGAVEAMNNVSQMSMMSIGSEFDIDPRLREQLSGDTNLHPKEETGAEGLHSSLH